MNLTGEIPIVIGTVPLNMNFMNSRPENVTLNMNGAQMQGQQIGWLTNPDGKIFLFIYQSRFKNFWSFKLHLHMMNANLVLTLY